MASMLDGEAVRTTLLGSSPVTAHRLMSLVPHIGFTPPAQLPPILPHGLSPERQ
jgi:hypothetical protein